MLCFTEAYLVLDNDVDKRNRSILKNDSQDEYQSVLLAFDDSIFEYIFTLWIYFYNGTLYVSLVSKSKNQVLNIRLVYDNSNVLSQRFLEAVRYMVLYVHCHHNKNYDGNGPITQGLFALTFVELYNSSNTHLM